MAGFVPTDFWNNVRKELDATKPVFMLAEWEARDLHAEAFDMTYGWHWNDVMHKIAMGEADVSALHVYYSWNEKAYPFDIMRMLFVSNHDKNAWEGTEFEQFGEALEAAIVLSVVSEGLPLIYNGQEAGNPRRLAFFEKDPIDWQPHPLGDLYKMLFKLKRGNTALWNAAWGARMINVANSAPAQVLSFVRRNERDRVWAVFNFSDRPQAVTFTENLHHGWYVDFMSGERVLFGEATGVELDRWGWRVYVGHNS